MNIALAPSLWNTVGLLARERHHGVSPEAATLRLRTAEILGNNLKSLTIRRTPVGALEALEEARSSATASNWDGYQAMPLDHDAYLHAVDFLKALPTDVPLPEVSVDPDGEVSVEWNLGRRCILTVSVGAQGRLAYSALIGVAKTRGIEWLVNGVPRAIADALGRVMATANESNAAAVR